MPNYNSADEGQPTSDSPPSRDPVFIKMEADMERYAQIRKEVRATTVQKKGRQKDLGGNIVSVSDVEEDRAHIEYTQIVLKTEKFQLKTRVETIKGMSPPQLQGHVRKRMRPIPKADILKGDFDKHAEALYIKLKE